MVALADIERALDLTVRDRPQWRCLSALDLYSQPGGDSLTTQVAAGRRVRAIALDQPTGALCLQGCEDDYPGWLALGTCDRLGPADGTYAPPVVTREMVEARIPAAIAFAKAAMAVPNEYLWGGSTAPNYDCSGLVQAAFASAGIWLPRDSYLQQDFTLAIAEKDLQAGDLLFFGSPDKTDHVALYLGDGSYIHSSGHDYGRGTISIDRYEIGDDAIGTYYYQRRRGAGRIMAGYMPVAQVPS